MSEIEEFLSKAAESVNAELDWLIPAEGRGPQNLRDAMRWSLFAGGKRFRPALVMAAGRNFGAEDRQLLRTAAAVEMIHTYSLIHDDLPSMDNDDLRRGRETCHIKFGESTAILAGDTLQALAFQTIAEDENLRDGTKTALISGLGKAAASMVVGQQLDLESEGKNISLEELELIHRNKTGALIAFSSAAGATIAGAAEDDIAAISDFGKKIGLLFQIVDDLLDVTATTESLGKTVGKDKNAGKATYPSLLGVSASKEFANSICADAESILAGLSKSNGVLKELPRYLLGRQF